MQAVRKVLTTLTLAGLLSGFGTSASAAPKITITATPSSLSFSAKLGAGAPAAQVVSIGGAYTHFAVSADQSWIVFPANSNTDRNLRLSVKIAGLPAGTYTGHALLSGAHIANSPLSIPITLVISPTAAAPTVTGQPSNQTVNVTQTGTFSVAASGTAPLTYQWSKNGAAVIGATSAAYTTPATLNTDNGASFSVAVHNTAGTATSKPAVLRVIPAAIAPAITTQPISQTVNAGQTATFSVAATGTAPLVYQWTKNGAAVFGATSATYTTPATVATDTLSTFAVTVHNGTGNATSSAATLTVASSAVTINAAPTSFSFALTLGGTAPAQQSVTINSSSPSGAQAFSLSADQTWIKLDITSGTTPGTAKISVATGSLAAGTYNGHVVITAAGVTNSPLSIPVALVISPATLASSLTVNPSSLNFPNVTVSTSSVQGISVTNSGTATINLSNVSVSGPGFTGSGVSAGLILAPSQTAMLNVTFAPATAGGVGGGVILTSNATNSPSSIGLTGTGVAAITPNEQVSTVTGLTPSTTTPSYGASVMFTATVTGSNPTGTVTFVGYTYWALGVCTLSNGSCTLSLSNLIPGPQSVVAQYGGDSGNLSSNSASVSLMVGPRDLAPSITTLNASSSSAPSGTSVELTASVSPASATGTVTFTDGSTVLGSAPLAPVVGSGAPTSLFGLTTTWTYLTPPVNYQTVRSLSMQPWIYWEEVNPSNGTYNWANLDAWVAANAGKDMIYDLAYTPQWASLYPNNNAGACSPPSSLTYWDSYLTAIATRYPQIKYWEIWNEPQDPMQWCGPTVGSNGPISTLAIMSQHASRIIKGINPSAVILSPATTSWYPGGLGAAWMSTFLSDGGTFDVFAFHGYIANPGMAEDEVGIVNSIQSVMEAAGISTPIWDTEAGWYTGAQPVLATARQPGFLAKMYIIQQSLGVARFVWYEYQEQPAWGEMYNPSTGDNANVPAYNAVYNWLTGAALSTSCSVTSNIETCDYTRPGGYVAQAVWETNSLGATYNYTYPPGMTQYLDLTGAVHPLSGGTITIGDAPILLENADIPPYSAILSSTTLPIGTNSITATYGGDTYDATSTTSLPTTVVIVY